MSSRSCAWSPSPHYAAGACSTSPKTISTGTTRWPPTSRRRRAIWTRRRRRSATPTTRPCGAALPPAAAAASRSCADDADYVRTSGERSPRRSQSGERVGRRRRPAGARPAQRRQRNGGCGARAQLSASRRPPSRRRWPPSRRGGTATSSIDERRRGRLRRRLEGDEPARGGGQLAAYDPWCGSPAVCSRAPTSTSWSRATPRRLRAVVLIGRDRAADRSRARATRTGCAGRGASLPRTLE